MSIRTSPWPTGMPCWADVSVPDVDAAKAFYAAVLGWTYQDTEAEYGGYAVAQVSGAAAAGIGPMQPGGHPAWTLYLAGDDVDATAAGIGEHDGTVLLAPGDVGTLGRMCIAADPTGAVFGVWQAGSHIGAGAVNQPGGLNWEDLRTSAPDTARPFYEAVFGYRTEPLAEAGPDYSLFYLPGEDTPLGGIGGMMGAEGQAPHWLLYFGVADAEVAVEAARNGGGTALMDAFETPYGTMAGIVDPAGAVFWVIQAPEGARQPDRSG